MSSHDRFALAGALGCAVTHGALTPVDVVKTRIQLDPEVYNKVGQVLLSLLHMCLMFGLGHGWRIPTGHRC